MYTHINSVLSTDRDTLLNTNCASLPRVAGLYKLEQLERKLKSWVGREGMVDIGGGRVSEYGQNTWYETSNNKDTKKKVHNISEIIHVLDFRF